MSLFVANAAYVAKATGSDAVGAFLLDTGGSHQQRIAAPLHRQLGTGATATVLGAKSGQLRGMVLTEALLLAAGGLAGGALIGWALSRPGNRDWAGPASSPRFGPRANPPQPCANSRRHDRRDPGLVMRRPLDTALLTGAGQGDDQSMRAVGQNEAPAGGPVPPGGAGPGRVLNDHNHHDHAHVDFRS
ncbi:hypothetical protein ACF1AO_19715 [Streptomyces longwoodensis]|uniref:hypothetical protein n=1 Tax=Streptomyces longwoodensis TaxID=68231 RepID=UPI0036F7A2CD